MKKVDTWLKVNKLSLNISKTQFMLFKGNKTAHYYPKISVDSKYITQVNCTKFLGIMIDDKLTWKHHIEYISKKIARGIGILWKLCPNVNQSILKNLYYTFIYPYITYCIHAWGNACKCYLKKIVALQKKIVRIIAYAKYNSTTKHLYEELKFLPFEHLHNLSIGMFMYKYAHNELPCIFKDWFTYNHEIHSYNTRQSQHLHPEQFLYDRGLKCLRYHGVLLWNRILEVMNTDVSLEIFKKNMKTKLAENAFLDLRLG